MNSAKTFENNTSHLVFVVRLTVTNSLIYILTNKRHCQLTWVKREH